MKQHPQPHRPGHYFDLPPRLRWIAWPVWVVGGVVVAIGLWLEGPEACLPLATLLVMGALLCALDYLCFRGARVRSENTTQHRKGNDK